MAKVFLRVAVNPYIPIFRDLDARGGRKLQTDRHTHGTTTVTLAAHARRGLSSTDCHYVRENMVSVLLRQFQLSHACMYLDGGMGGGGWLLNSLFLFYYLYSWASML